MRGRYACVEPTTGFDLIVKQGSLFAVDEYGVGVFCRGKALLHSESMVVQ